MSFFVWFLKNPLLGLAGVAVLGLSLTCGWLLWDNASLTKKGATAQITINNLRTERDALTSSVNNLEKEIKLTATMQAIVEQSIRDALKRNEVEKTQLEEINRAPDSEDGPIAPVLRRALGLQPGDK